MGETPTQPPFSSPIPYNAMPLAGEEQESADMEIMPMNVAADAARVRGDLRKCQEVRCLANPDFWCQTRSRRPEPPRAAPQGAQPAPSRIWGELSRAGTLGAVGGVPAVGRGVCCSISLRPLTA